MMQVEPLGIDGAFVITPDQHVDPRGVFLESFRVDHLEKALGHPLKVQQTNISTSSRGTLRGIHFADVPPSQAKYVTAVSGSLLDYVVDLRLGSPTFGQHEVVRLDNDDRRAVYLAEGLGHAFCALEDDSVAVYLCSATYAPLREHGIHPLDPAIGLQLPEGIEPILSEKDESAPTLAEAEEAGLLPTWADCQDHYAALRRGERS